MKIAIVSFGHVDVILPLYKRLKETEIDVDLIFCFSLNRKSESILNFSDKIISTGFSDSHKTNELLGPEIKDYLGDSSTLNFFIFHNLKLRSFRNFILSNTLAKSLKNYDVIHFNGTNGILPVLILLLRKKGLIFTIHDVTSHSGEKTRYNFAERLNGFIFKSKYPVIIQNLPDYKKLQNQFYSNKDKFNYVPFGVLDVYKSFEKGDPGENESDLLFFGRISPYKGIQFLISAIEVLNKKGMVFKTKIVGQGDISIDKQKLAELNIELINSYIPSSELVSFIKQTKVVVCPYTDATQSGVVMTAYAFNKPVIASAVGNFPEVIKNGITGFLVKPADPNDLSDKIQILLTSTELIFRMSSNISEFVNNSDYAWDKISILMTEIYKSVYTKLEN